MAQNQENTAQNQENAAQKEKSVIPEDVGKALGHLEKIRDLIRTESTRKSEIGERQKGVGLQKLEMVNELSTSRHNALSSLVEELWDFVEDMPGLSENSKKNWCKVIDRLARSLQDEGTKQKVDIHFTSPGKEGTVYINYMTFGLSDVPGKFQCATFRMSACFALMPDWYIEDKQKTRKGFFKSSSKSEQKIVYVERGITEDDLKNLLLICMPNIKSEVVFPALM